MKIMFSPLGGTDPMPETNFRDGSMIHIARVYDIDKIVLYMSKEILEREEQDNRYTYCIEKLAELKGKTIEYEIIERPELTDVHDYNYFFEEFEGILTDIKNAANEDDEIFLNVSSGSPAMKSALLVLQHLWEAEYTSVQVTTPTKKMNVHTHSDSKEYDIKTRWELNEDNEENLENRCIEVQSSNLMKIKNEEIIKKLIRVYDYDAAILMAENIRDGSRYIDILKIAKDRLLMDFSSVDKRLAQIQDPAIRSAVCPVEQSDERPLFEYVLSLDIKLKKHQYADFIRALSPIIKEVFQKIIEKGLNIDINNLCIRRRGENFYRWNEKNLANCPDIKNILEEEYSGFKYNTPVYSSHLFVIINWLIEDEDIKNTVTALRVVEENVRNIAAHEIVSVDSEFIKEKSGLPANQIIREICKAIGYAGINNKGKFYDSYEEMNDMIIQIIKKSAK